jgi:hypothetical protein
MQLTSFDWLVIAAILPFQSRHWRLLRAAGAREHERVLSLGARRPMWLAGTSMVATTFAADTPLAVTGFVAKNGIAGNWLWWNFVMSGMMTVFPCARLWRRPES